MITFMRGDFQHWNFRGKDLQVDFMKLPRGGLFPVKNSMPPQINGKIVGPKPTFFGCPGIFFSTSMIRLLEFDQYNSISPSNDGKNMGMILWPLV